MLSFASSIDVLRDTRVTGLEHERFEDCEADGAACLHGLYLLVPHRLPGHHRGIWSPAHLTGGGQGKQYLYCTPYTHLVHQPKSNPNFRDITRTVQENKIIPRNIPRSI